MTEHDGTNTAPHGAMAAALSGVRQALPIVMGYVPVGFAYGVLSQKVGMDPASAVGMSIFVFAGSAQFIAVGLLAAGAPPLTIIITTFIVNLRHLLMSAALAPHLGAWGRIRQALFAYELTDETFALHAMRFGQGRLRPAETFGINVTAQCSWVLGSALGIVASTLVADVRPLALDYALTAMFIALLVAQVRERTHLVVALFAAALSIGLALSGADNWNVILATLAGASLGLVLTTCRTR